MFLTELYAEVIGLENMFDHCRKPMRSIKTKSPNETLYTLI